MKKYVMKRHTGGNPWIVIHIIHEKLINLFVLGPDQKVISKLWEPDILFSSGTALEIGNYGWKVWIRNFFDRISDQERLLLRLKYEVKRISTPKPPVDRKPMLRLIRGVDNLISTLNGRTK